jgi:dipeptidyl aminopeptidase/acylaminoacyl peptidase
VGSLRRARALTLRELLELRVAAPADFGTDGRLLVRSDLPGTMQLFRVPPLEPLTALDEPVNGRYVGDSERILVEKDEGGNERIQLHLLDGGLEPLVVEPDFIHMSPRTSRDGSLLAYACNRRNGVDFDVYVRSLETGAERLVLHAGAWCEPESFSPGGRTLAVHRETAAPGVEELHLVDLASGATRLVTPPGEEASVGPPAWLDERIFLCATSLGRDVAGVARWDGLGWSLALERDWDMSCVVDRAGRVAAVETNEDGYSRVELLDARTLERLREVELPGRGVAQELVFSRDGDRLAFQFVSPVEPGDVWTCDVSTGRVERVTGKPPSADLVEPSLHRFASFDGVEVPVFLYEPRTPPPWPVVVSVHGGPEAQARPVFAPFLQHLVGRGYAVAVPNVRGSTGYGRRYEHLDDVRLRLDSVRDLAALHDWLGARPEIDASRAVLYGRSYGGFMVLAGLAFQPERWAAGVEAVGISNLVTFLENTSGWRRAVREREYGSLERERDFLEEISPLNHVGRVRVPLFIQHGANDPRVPVSESRQIHAALTARGIRCDLVVFEDEGHQLGKLENRVEAFERAASFLDEVVGTV